MTKLMKDKSTWKHHIRFFSHDFRTWSFAAAVEHPALRTIPNLIDGGDGAKQQQTTVPKKARTRTWQQERWKQRYQELAEYKKGHGHCNVPKGSIQEYKQLGEWVNTQRKIYSKMNMPKDRIEQLNAIGFDWDPLATKWNQMFQALVEYKKEHGDCNVPQRSTEYKQLGIWVTNQRFEYNKGGMPEHRINQLNNIGFDWDPLATQWNQMFQELMEYKKEHGDCNVPHRSIEYKQLGIWVKNRRKQYNKGGMSKDRIEQLNAIGFDWDPLVTQWNIMFQELVKYKKEHGDCNVPVKSEGKCKELGKWVDNQRVRYIKGGMLEDRVKQLNAIGFDWYPLVTQWNQIYEALQEFHKIFKHFHVPKNYEPCIGLARWIQTQRREYRKFVNSERTSMSEERIDKLESIGFEWNPDRNGVTEQENIHFGDAIVERGDKTLRFLFQNPNGISSVNNFDQAGQYGSNLKIFNVNVACLCETRTDFSKGGVLEAIEGQLQQSWNQRILLQHSSSNDTFASIAQPGGTLTVVTGDCISDIRSTDHDSRGLGRWSTVTFGGNDEQRLTIINSYRVCNQNESAGETTTYMQQVRLLQKEGRQKPDPRQTHLDDLSECIGQYKDRRHEIILVIDANEIMRPGGKLTEFVEELDLREPIKERFASDIYPIPSTYWRGSNQIDFMFTTKGIDEYIRRCGYLQFNQVLRSDHRGIFFDLDLDGFLGRSTLSRDLLLLPMILPSTRKDTL